MQLRVKALETILTEKGYVDQAALDQIVENYETQIGPHIGARVVARAWVDPEFKRHLFEERSRIGHAMLNLDPLITRSATAGRTATTDRVYALALPAKCELSHT